MSVVVHLVGPNHWSGYCPATTGSGTEDLSQATCSNCLSIRKAVALGLGDGSDDALLDCMDVN